MRNPLKLIKNKLSGFRAARQTIKAEGLGSKVLWDYAYCRRKFKCNLEEYMGYQFYNYKNRYRKNFIVSAHRNQFVKINTRAFTYSKYVFYQYLPDMFQREMILAPNCGEDAFVDFLKKHKRIVTKPDMGSLGKDVMLLEYTDDAAARAYFQEVAQNGYTVCEEFIKQHPALNELNPYSVNTIRVTSLLVDGEVEILTATLRCGAGKDSITDNLSKGGIGAQIDVETGIICAYGKDFTNNRYSHHPISGVQIIGMQIPNWEKAVAYVKQAHKRVPQCTLYGWDIAITEDGADIVEANSKPGIRNIQQLDGIPRGHKLLPLLKQDPLKGKNEEYYRDWRNRFYQYIDSKWMEEKTAERMAKKAHK